MNTVDPERLRRAYDAAYIFHTFVFPDDDGVVRRSCIGRLGCQVASTYLRNAEIDGLTADELYTIKALAIGYCSANAHSCDIDSQLGETWGAIPFMLAGGVAQVGKPSGLTSGARPPGAVVATEVNLNPWQRRSAKLVFTRPHENNRTIAVGVDGKGKLHAGSSNGFDAGQRAVLKRLGVSRVRGSGSLHAEEELLRGFRISNASVRSPWGAGEHNCSSQPSQGGVKVEP